MNEVRTSTVTTTLVSTGKVPDTVTAFVVGAALMMAAGLAEIFLGVKAERRSLEDIARPLTAHEPITLRSGQTQPAT